MAKLTSTIGRKRAEEARPRMEAGKKRMVMREGARRRLRRKSRSTPGKRGLRLALGERLQQRVHPLQPSNSGGLAPDSAPQEEALNAPLTPPAEEAPSPPPAAEAAHGVPAPDAEASTPPPPEPVQAAEPQPADDMLWSQLLSRVPADYSLPDEVIAEALQHALAANISRRGAWPRLWRRIQLRYNVTYSHIT
ncbi:hypothetical protein [Paenibacillus dendritiformis]|uniref:hypothetical protein n=1 Tax=Paenibacillus dendritiformis TaxID=130049 RepID=UPI000DA7FF9A|nr:hypothetical protein [Paenibacillus dendritiformis]PZM65244.1 hypothetical protein DOE73_12890 [Paenibacillus dendritiformis]